MMMPYPILFLSPFYVALPLLDVPLSSLVTLHITELLSLPLFFLSKSVKEENDEDDEKE